MFNSIAGATNVSYTTGATVVGDSGAPIRCVATNTVSSATSNAATLTVNTTPPPPPPPPTAPSALIAAPASASQITLAWMDNANDETGFEIQRGTDGLAFVNVGTVTANVIAFDDSGLAAATHYFYRVRAVNAEGDSAYSNIADTLTNSWRR